MIRGCCGWLALALSSAGLGCTCDGHDETSSAANSAGESSSSTSSSSSSSSNTSSETETASGPSSSDTGSAGVFLIGTVFETAGNWDVPGARVWAYSDPKISAVADEVGTYTIGPLPPEQEVILVVDPVSAEAAPLGEDLLGGISLTQTLTHDFNTTPIVLVPENAIDERAVDQVALDASRSAVLVGFQLFSGIVGVESLLDGSVTVTMDPAPSEGTYFPTSPEGSPTITALGGIPGPRSAIFYNLPETTPGEIRVTVEHDNPDKWDCAPIRDKWPTIGGHVTFVYIACECRTGCD